MTPSHRPTPSGLGASANEGALGFATQEHLSEITALPRTVREGVVGTSVSYSYYRHPQSRTDPRNFVPLTPEQARAIERAEASDLPTALIEQISRLRYPTLWDAVRTTPAVAGDPENALETYLAAHANDVLSLNFPGSSTVTASEPEFLRNTAADRLASSFLIVDGEPHRGRHLDLAPGIVALGALVLDQYVTVVYDRHLAPAVALELTRRSPAVPHEVTA